MSASKRLRVCMPDGGAYEVRIGPGSQAGLGRYLSDLGVTGRLVLISDSNVAPLYGAALRASLVEAGFAVTDLVVPAGEESKSVECAEQLCSAMASEGVTRGDTVLALGGGVVGDLAGFVSSVYMRGIDYVQVPTTLLAMVDSSVGGKTAVNLPEGKNLIGCFKRPVYVLADTASLATLPQDQWANGLAEATKSAVLCGGGFWEWLSSNLDAVAAHDDEAVRDLVVRCVTFKADVVARDETEVSGVRECLNYGHTLGHAIESCAGYGTFGHGVAVAEGMRFAARLAVEVLGCPVEFVLEQDAVLDRLGLPALSWGASADDMIDAMRRDKKVRDGELRFVLPRDVGDWEVVAVDSAVVRNHVEAWARSKGM